jgi:hypothetical protein
MREAAEAAQFAEVFTGIEVDHSRRVVIVHRIPDQDFDRTVNAAAGGAVVELRAASTSRRTASALAARVMRDRKSLEDAGIKAFAASVTSDGRVIVEVEQAAARATQGLHRRYGQTVSAIEGEADEATG